jgi:Ser/Thr protein kinase RdoA (MazF antagonist)
VNKNNLDTAELNQLFRAYSHKRLINSGRILEAHANDVYRVTDSSNNKYVLRILKVPDETLVNIEAIIQKKLMSNGVNSPQYLDFGNHTFLGEVNGKYFTLSKFIKGVTPTAVTPGLVKDFGYTLSKIHNSLTDISIPRNQMQWFDLQIAEADFEKYDGPLKERINLLFGNGRNLLNLGLPQAVIHGDLRLGNVFAEGDKISAVFDFETAQNTLRIFDLSLTYISIKRVTELTDKQIRSLLFSGYDSFATLSLTDVEKINFGQATAFVSAAAAIWFALNAPEYIEPYLKIGEAGIKNL